MLPTLLPSTDKRMKRSLPKFGARWTINLAVLPLGVGAGVGRGRASLVATTNSDMRMAVVFTTRCRDLALNFSLVQTSMKLSPVLILASLSVIVSSVIADEPPITEQDLVRRTQELYDAAASGNQNPWKKYFADDCTFSDEKGRTFDKPKLIADITPLPKGYSGTIKIEKVISRIVGNTAVLSYDANETETIFGQELHARYHITDTWLRTKRELANYRQPGPPLL